MNTLVRSRGTAQRNNEPGRSARGVVAWLLLVWALLSVGVGDARAAEFLAPEQAFRVSARLLTEPRTVEVLVEVAPGYYLYREKLAVSSADAALAAVPWPRGAVKFDETFQKDVETLRDQVRVRVPIARGSARSTLAFAYQGCADDGLCYPPMQARVEVGLPGFGGDGLVRVTDDSAAALLAPAAGGSVAGAPGAPAGLALASPSGGAEPGVSMAAVVPPSGGVPPDAGSESGRLSEVLQSGRGWRVVAVFLLAGVLLSLTPCVLPMLPILSSVIVGHGRNVTRGRGLALASAYSLGMALVYTALGVAAGLAGEGLAAALQQPAVLAVFALGLVVLALSMFGLYELQLPAFITQRLTRTSQGLPAGELWGVGLMGGVSALLVSPCVAAPLAGALVYISQTRDAALGGLALFALAAGMSVPLLLIGASAGALLPRAGAWMADVKHFFGALLLGVALWTVQSLLPASAVLAAWGSWLLFLAVFFGSPRPTGHARHAAWRRTLRHGVALVLGVAGVLQWVGAASGGTDPLQPLARWASAHAGGGASAPALAFRTVRNVAELDAALATAARPVMLDFYADWCVSCKEMERYTFADPQVRARLAGALLLKADVTANNDEDRALLRRFGLFGPPGTLFFDGQGREIAPARVIGYQDAPRFLKTLSISGL